MDIKDLQQHYRVKKEVERTSQKLTNLQKSATYNTAKGSSNFAPYQERVFTVTGVSGRNKKAYNEYKRILEERLEELRNNILEVERFISSVTSSEIRQIIDCRYIQGLSWVATSKRVYGDPSENRARMALNRYLKKK